ncbi:MAG TPA: hypothetical protein VFA48_12740 [Gammaproteobacteria bacterium]|nr:hypothetical protein [Gammaproteobacteria bacterium]
MERRLPQSRLHRFLGAAWTLLLVAYVTLVAIATASGHAEPAAWLLVLILVLGTVHALLEKNRTAAVIALFNLAVVAITFSLKGPVAALSLTTAIIQALICWLFLRGLRPGKTDIITRIACAIRPERNARERAYIRTVAWCWATLMGLMGATSFTIAFVPSGAFWWWWMNIAPFALPIGFFVLEWLFRQFWLHQELKAGGPIDWTRIRNIDFLQLFQP